MTVAVMPFLSSIVQKSPKENQKPYKNCSTERRTAIGVKEEQQRTVRKVG